MAHTGSLAGAMEAFDAVAGDIGVMRASTLDDAVEITELLAHTGAPAGRRLGAITLSGAFRGLLFDAAEKNNLQFPTLADETLTKLNAILRVGSLVSNPIDGGFGVLTSADNYQASIDALQSDPNVDMILLQESLPFEPGSDRAEHYIALVDAIVAAGAPKPIAFITPVTIAKPTIAARCGRSRRMSRSCRRPTRRCAPSMASFGAMSSSVWRPLRRAARPRLRKLPRP